MTVINPLENEAVVFDIIEEYNATEKKLEELNEILVNYQKNHEENEKIEAIYRNAAKGPPEKQEDVLQDDESLDF